MPTRHTLRTLLQSLGIRRILETGEGWEAVSMMREELVDVVLTDWSTPDLAGVDLIRTLRHQGRNRSVPVILLDEGLPQSTVVAAIKAGAAHRLVVPPDRKKLKSILQGLGESQPHECTGT